MNKGTSYRNFTEYPHIFGCYWGSFKSENHEVPKDLGEVIDNRNDFVVRYDIKNSCSSRFSKPPKYIKNVWVCLEKIIGTYADHTESYVTNSGGFVFLMSPYYTNDEIESKLLGLGWTKIYKLYSPGATSYIKTYTDSEQIKCEIRSYKKMHGIPHQDLW